MVVVYLIFAATRDRTWKERMKLAAFLSSVVAVFLIVAAVHDRFLSPKGGLFCPDLEQVFEEIKASRLCVSSGIFFATSFTHMGDEGMYLLKFGQPLFRKCFWVNGRVVDVLADEKVIFSPDPPHRVSGDYTFSCFQDVIVQIQKKNEGTP